jgi:hypothetical protein
VLRSPRPACGERSPRPCAAGEGDSPRVLFATDFAEAAAHPALSPRRARRGSERAVVPYSLRPLVQHRLEIGAGALRLGAGGVAGIDEAEIAVNEPLARMIFHMHASMDQRVRERPPSRQGLNQAVVMTAGATPERFFAGSGDSRISLEPKVR